MPKGEKKRKKNHACKKTYLQWKKIELKKQNKWLSFAILIIKR